MCHVAPSCCSCVLGALFAGVREVWGQGLAISVSSASCTRHAPDDRNQQTRTQGQHLEKALATSLGVGSETRSTEHWSQSDCDHICMLVDMKSLCPLIYFAVKFSLVNGLNVKHTHKMTGAGRDLRHYCVHLTRFTDKEREGGWPGQGNTAHGTGTDSGTLDS